MVGARAVRVTVDPGRVEALRALLAHEPLPGQRELIAGGDSVTVRFDLPGSASDAALALRDLTPPPPAGADGPLVPIEVVYDGEDLAAVAQHLGTDPAGVVRMHTEQHWYVGFVGFAPGFAYLRPDRPGPPVPRRATPRVRVPPGSVALAGEFSAVYPRTSPGGWQLIGRTDTELWDLDRDPPALLGPGSRVRFTAVRERITVAGEPAPAPASRPLTAAPPQSPAVRAELGLQIADPGLRSLIEDSGRPGLAAQGVTRSGAADRSALLRANRLVGNPTGAAGIESLAGGIELIARGDQVLAVTGARAPLVLESPDGRWREIEPDTPFALLDGDHLIVGSPTAGLRTVVAVRGGIDGPVVLGSRSSDTLARLGPPALQTGDVLPVGPAPRGAVGAPEPAPPLPDGSECTVDVVRGPDLGLLPDDSWRRLLETAWTVSPDSDRVGVRLTGPPLAGYPGEVLSRALIPGAVQLPPSGQPIVFGVDHPTTGGYPLIGVIAEHHLDLLAQVPIGTVVRLREVSEGGAVSA
ncbi:5-oxoprolinase/urea amidolyase family protein [Tsukamurella serpentis]